MNEQERIEKIVKTLEKEVNRYKRPAVTKVAYTERSPFKVLIACLLSLRTKDEVTEKAAPRLFALADTPEKMLKLSIKQIEKAVYPVGFYKTKAKRIKEICKTLIENYNSKVPDEIDELLKLKGVGRKTAGITMVYGFNKNVSIPTDVHVHVVSNRLGWVNTKTPEKTEIQLMQIIPKRYWHDLNDLLVAFGQNVCLTKKPKCWICPITKYCRYYRTVYLPSIKKN